MKRYVGVEPREGFRVTLTRKVWVRMPKGKTSWQQPYSGGLTSKMMTSIFEECETNERCLAEALAMMEDEANHEPDTEIQIEEFYEGDWDPVLAWGWDATTKNWVKRRMMATGSTATAKVRVALVVPGEPNVMVQDCGEEVGDCARVLNELRKSAAWEGAQLHVQVRTPSGGWGSMRYEEFRMTHRGTKHRMTGHGPKARGHWVMVAMPSELVYLRNRRAR